MKKLLRYLTLAGSLLFAGCGKELHYNYHINTFQDTDGNGLYDLLIIEERDRIINAHTGETRDVFRGRKRIKLRKEKTRAELERAQGHPLIRETIFEEAGRKE